MAKIEANRGSVEVFSLLGGKAPEPKKKMVVTDETPPEEKQHHYPWGDNWLDLRNDFLFTEV